jgi:hypothetical protein
LGQTFGVIREEILPWDKKCQSGGLIVSWNAGIPQKNFPKALRFRKVFLSDGGRLALAPVATVEQKLNPMPVVQTLTVLLLMTIFAQALFTLVRGNLVTFTFFSARHTAAKLNVKVRYLDLKPLWLPKSSLKF